ncbi:hypothetical protein EG68_08607, partial [Paragonimus skrjabini miyazakii]
LRILLNLDANRDFPTGDLVKAKATGVLFTYLNHTLCNFLFAREFINDDCKLERFYLDDSQLLVITLLHVNVKIESYPDLLDITPGDGRTFYMNWLISQIFGRCVSAVDEYTDEHDTPFTTVAYHDNNQISYKPGKFRSLSLQKHAVLNISPSARHAFVYNQQKPPVCRI